MAALIERGREHTRLEFTPAPSGVIVTKRLQPLGTPDNDSKLWAIEVEARVQMAFVRHADDGPLQVHLWPRVTVDCKMRPREESLLGSRTSGIIWTAGVSKKTLRPGMLEFSGEWESPDFDNEQGVQTIGAKIETAQFEQEPYAHIDEHFEIRVTSAFKALPFIRNGSSLSPAQFAHAPTIRTFVDLDWRFLHTSVEAPPRARDIVPTKHLRDISEGLDDFYNDVLYRWSSGDDYWTSERVNGLSAYLNAKFGLTPALPADLP